MQVYKITNLSNGKIYIGKDTTSDENYYGSGLLIKRALNKYGKDSFLKEVIDEAENNDILSLKEKHWINFFNSTDREIGYNISPGGDGGDTLSNHPDLERIKKKIADNNPKTGKTYEEAFGVEKAKEYKKKLSKNLHKNILSKESKEKHALNWEKYRENFKARCEFIKKEIEQGNSEAYIEELRMIKSRVSSCFLKNAKGFYDFFGDDLRYVFGHMKIPEHKNLETLEKTLRGYSLDELITYMKEKTPNYIFPRRKNFYEFIGKQLENDIKNALYKNRKVTKQKTTTPVIIDGVEYESISDAAKILNIDRSLLRSRLKSPHFKNYLFHDEELNIKYKKYEVIDPHLSKKERISIGGIIYESITEAANYLNKSDSYIHWRLNSKSYPEWFYLNKEVELKETGLPKAKSVSIIGKEYESITKAVEGSGIDRQIIRYRLKSDNFPDYFYT
jgi:hypothetical protein